MGNTSKLILTPWRNYISWFPMESFMKSHFSLLQHSGSHYFSLFPLLSIKPANPQGFPTLPLQQPHIIPKCSCCYAWSFTFYFHYPDVLLPSPSPMVDQANIIQKAIYMPLSHSAHSPASTPSILVATLSNNNRYCICVFSSRCSVSLNKV